MLPGVGVHGGGVGECVGVVGVVVVGVSVDMSVGGVLSVPVVV